MHTGVLTHTHKYPHPQNTHTTHTPTAITPPAGHRNGALLHIFRGVLPLFKAEPLLEGKCLARYLRTDGCVYDNCAFCKTSIAGEANTDLGDLERAVRRACGLTNARERAPTPGRNRSDSVGSASSMGSQNSTGGGHKPKKPRQ